MSARSYVRDARGRFAVVRANRNQKQASRRAAKITKYETKSRQHSGKARLSDQRLGLTGDLHRDAQYKYAGKAARLQQKNKAKGFNREGVKTGKAIGMRGVRKEQRQRAKDYRKRRTEGLKVQAATGVSIRQQQRNRAAARRAVAAAKKKAS